jgi:hypothetical protein
MEDLSNCITRVTQELRTLQEQFQCAGFQSSDPSIQNRVLNDLLNIGLIQDLKSAVDHMRHFLWSYIDSAAANYSRYGQVDQALQSHHLTQVTEMLHLLYGSTASPQHFVERVTLTVGRLLEEHDLQHQSSGEQAA